MKSLQNQDTRNSAERATQHLVSATRELAKIGASAFREARSTAEVFTVSEAEVEAYNVARALMSLAEPRLRAKASLEDEIGQRAQACGLTRHAGALFIPFEVLARDLHVSTSTAGGNLVATQLDSVVPWLRPASAVLQAGATTIEGLTGNVAIPRFTAGGEVVLVAESEAGAETSAEFDQLFLTPRTASAYVDYSRKLGLQVSSRQGGASGIIAADLASAFGALLDLLALNGTGEGEEPTGLLYTAGIGSVPLGVNGEALTWDAITDLEYEVAEANGSFGSLGYITNPKVKRQLQRTPILASGSPIWMREGGRECIAGVPAWATTNVPDDLTKGSSENCSALIHGNWNNLVLATWGRGIEVLIDPYTHSRSGTVRLVAMLDFDCAVRRAQTFSVISDVVAP